MRQNRELFLDINQKTNTRKTKYQLHEGQNDVIVIMQLLLALLKMNISINIYLDILMIKIL